MAYVKILLKGYTSEDNPNSGSYQTITLIKDKDNDGEERNIIVFDEFTSVVNREVAKTGSFAISKAVRATKKKFVAVSCHRDVFEWLEPDWVYDTDCKQFFFIQKTQDRKDRISRLKYIDVITRLKKSSGKCLGDIII